MANENQVVRVINEQPIISNLIEKYTDDDLRRILSNPQSSRTFFVQLLRTYEDEQNGPKPSELQKLWDAAKSLSNFGRLKHFIEMLKPARYDLLKSLEVNANKIEQYVKLGLCMKIIGSAGDIAGTVGNFIMGNSNSDYLNWAFAANVLGFLGDAAPMGGAYFSNDAYNDTVKKIQIDQTLSAPVYKWFQQSRELQEAMENIFPFDYKEIYLELLCEAEKTELRGAQLLANFFESVVRNGIERLRDREFLEIVMDLVSRDILLEELIEWFRFLRREIQYNILTMAEQLPIESILKIGCRQATSSLSSKYQKSYLVLPRIGWNIWSILQAVSSLSKSEISQLPSEMRRIRKYLSDEMVTLEKIMGYMERKRNEQIH